MGTYNPMYPMWVKRKAGQFCCEAIVIIGLPSQKKIGLPDLDLKVIIHLNNSFYPRISIIKLGTF